MQAVPYAGCCTAKVVTGFGQTDTADYNYRPGIRLTQGDIENELQKMCEEKKLLGYGILTAITNDDQTTANKALLAQGWEHSKWASKSQHRDKKIRLWFKCLMDVEN